MMSMESTERPECLGHINKGMRLVYCSQECKFTSLCTLIAMREFSEDHIETGGDDAKD